MDPTTRQWSPWFTFLMLHAAVAIILLGSCIFDTCSCAVNGDVPCHVGVRGEFRKHHRLQPTDCTVHPPPFLILKRRFCMYSFHGRQLREPTDPGPVATTLWFSSSDLDRLRSRCWVLCGDDGSSITHAACGIRGCLEVGQVWWTYSVQICTRQT